MLDSAENADLRAPCAHRYSAWTSRHQPREYEWRQAIHATPPSRKEWSFAPSHADPNQHAGPPGGEPPRGPDDDDDDDSDDDRRRSKDKKKKKKNKKKKKKDEER